MIEVSSVTVFSAPNCTQCVATKRWLESNDVPHEVRSVDERLEELKALGHFRAPVVVLPTGENWSGYRPDKLEKLKSDTKESA